MDKAKDFEKGWEEYKAKRKQEIEEMAKVLCINDNFVCETCPSENECFNYKHAKQLYDAGYRKIPENAVVLTEEELTERDYERYNLGYETHRQESQKREDYIETLSHHINDLENALLIVRKETAEKFALKLADYFVENCGGRLCLSLTLQEWYKMIDEICEEITDKEVQSGN